MRVLSFDQSLTHSAAVVLEQNSPGVVVLGDEYELEPCTRGIPRVVEIYDWMNDLIEKVQPHLVAREMHHMRQYGAAGGLQAVAVSLDIIAHRRRLLRGDYAVVSPSTWKKFCLGKGNLKKDTAYLMHINKFIATTGLLQVKPSYVVEDDNIADAICLGVCAYNAKLMMQGVELVATKTQQDGLAGSLKNMFEHE